MPESEVATGEDLRIIDDIIDKLYLTPQPPVAFKHASGQDNPYMQAPVAHSNLATPDNAYIAPEIEVAQPVGFPAPKGSVAQHN